MRSRQYSGVPGRTTLDSIAHAQLNKLLCILPSDSEAATNKPVINVFRFLAAYDYPGVMHGVIQDINNGAHRYK